MVTTVAADEFERVGVAAVGPGPPRRGPASHTPCSHNGSSARPLAVAPSPPVLRRRAIGGRAGNGRAGAVPPAGRIAGSDGWRSVPAVAGADQCGEPVRPSRPPVRAADEGPGPSGHRCPYAAGPASPRVTAVVAGVPGRCAV